MTEINEEALVAKLTASGKYRVLRLLEKKATVTPADGSETRLGIFVDVETTGLDPSSEIIELAMVPFTYSNDGRIFEIRDAFSQLRQPEKPIPQEITEVTGITNEMVAGKSIDPTQVAEFVKDAVLIIAHNAAFDRKFLERAYPTFATKPWACSMSQIEWSREGIESAKLAYLAMSAGFFYQKHRATSDCLAAIELLSTRLPKTGKPAMLQLLETARKPTWRIWADRAPFETKDILKARGYRWNGEGNAGPKCWYIDMIESEKDHELVFLREQIYQRDIKLQEQKITAYERFSSRA